MNRFKKRSAQGELIDQPGISFPEWATCLRELQVINRRLGGHAATIEGVRTLLPLSSGPLTVAEIGCGGGDNLRAIDAWSRHDRLPVRYIGIDLNEACVSFARASCRDLQHASFLQADYRDADFGGNKPDIIFNALFCHHFSNEELVEMFRWMATHSRVGFFVNDLERHFLAYYSIKALTRLFSRSRLVIHDAPVSVLRGFKRKELERLLEKAGLTHYTIRRRWAFRFLIVVTHVRKRSL